MTDTKTQAEKFKQTAKELETNDDEKTFDSKLKALAKASKEATKSK